MREVEAKVLIAHLPKNDLAARQEIREHLPKRDLAAREVQTWRDGASLVGLRDIWPREILKAFKEVDERPKRQLA